MRNKNQEWPEVPEMEKIQEQNPEILAMKILESGRQIEASKMKNVDMSRGIRDCNRYLMKPHEKNYGPQQQQMLVKPPTPQPYPSNNASPVNSEGALKVAFFEDRIKNIITNALNEDSKSPSYPRSSSSSDSWPPPTKSNAANSTSSFMGNDMDNGNGNSGEMANAKINVPDYTLVSPAKLALRRHLSQEKVLPQSSSNFIGTRTIGDLVSGEIERTLEISNQNIINTIVPMCLGSKNSSNLKRKDFTEALIEKSLANTSNASNGGIVNNNVNNRLAYNKNMQVRSSVLYSTSSGSPSVPYMAAATAAPSKYSPVHLPRAEMKPYHESYFADLKPAKEEPMEG